MRIVYYTDQIYLHGGLERVLANKLNYFSQNTNFELHVITFQQGNNPPCYGINDKVKFHDLSIKYDRKKSFLHAKNIKYAPRHYLKLKTKIKQIKPDVIVVCNYEYGFYFIPLITKKAIKIKEYHSSGHFNYISRLNNKKFIKKCVYKISDYFESRYNALVLLTKDELKYHCANNAAVIPNAITHVSSQSADLSNKKAISAGRIAPVKGFEYLIKSWQTVIESCPDWTLEIYGEGEGEYVKGLESLIKSLNLEKHVFLKGATQQLDCKMLESSIYIMSSLTECFPMVILEAMSCGLPVVSFDCPNGPRHMIEHNLNGLLVEYLNENKLSEGLIDLINNRDKRELMSNNAKISVNSYKESVIMPLWLNLFKKNHIRN